ncbi:MAG: PQQ-binding-like beta-propeller repeat protein [Planctomycetota bacterium]
MITNRGVDPKPERLVALFRDLQPDGPRFARQRAAFEQFRDPDFATREAAMRSLVAEPWIPPRLTREFSESPDPETRWRTRRVNQLAGAVQEQFARVANRIITAAGLADGVVVGGAPPAKPSTDRSSIYARASLGEHTLIATGTRGIAIELDGGGKEKWRVPFRAWSAERLEGGATLLASVEEQAVVEVDREGQVLWRYAPVAATRAKPLANGNVLVVDYPGGRVLELGRDQSIRWQQKIDEPCFDAERLDNGHTLIATANLIQEFAFDGVVVWQWQVRGRLNGLQSLPDGRILVANYGANEVAELDNDGRITRRIAEPQPSDAFRLPNGHTLVATATRVVEFNDMGELLRVLATARYGSARR